jgi:DNA-directed RNA polymerase specialized sigma24 family protein
MELSGDAFTNGAVSGHGGPANTHAKWVLTQAAFDRLLACLDTDREAAGRKYLEIRGNLMRFFEWRGCAFPEDHADETINRVARRVSEGEEIRNPAGYFVGVGRLVLLEVYKEREKQQLALSELAYTSDEHQQLDDVEPRAECLKRCLEGHTPENRELILQYYQGEKAAKIENRRKLSARLKTPLNTLRMRALRLRERLLICVTDCLKES